MIRRLLPEIPPFPPLSGFPIPVLCYGAVGDSVVPLGWEQSAAFRGREKQPAVHPFERLQAKMN